MESNQVLKRSDVPLEQTWNLEAIFPSLEDWEKALNGIEGEIDRIAHSETLCQASHNNYSNV